MIISERSSFDCLLRRLKGCPQTGTLSNPLRRSSSRPCRIHHRVR
jgi:hypothetical protein